MNDYLFYINVHQRYTIHNGISHTAGKTSNLACGKSLHYLIIYRGSDNIYKLIIMRANNPTPGIQSSYVNLVLPIFMLIKFVEVEVEVEEVFLSSH